MKTISNFTLLGSLFFFALPTLAQDFLGQGAVEGPERTATQPAVREKTSRIAVDAKTKTVTLEASVWQNNVGLEVFACGPMGREHETVLLVYHTPGELYSALREVGGLLPADMPGDEEALTDLRGRRLWLTVTWTGPDGKPVTRLAEELMLDDLTLQPASPVGWSFLAKDTGPEFAGKGDGAFEINLTYVGLRGEAEGLVEYAPARQQYAAGMYGCNGAALPREIPRPEGLPAKLNMQVVSEAEAMKQLIAYLQSRAEPGRPVPAFLSVAQSLLPTAGEIDCFKTAFFGSGRELLTTKGKLAAELAEKNVPPESLEAQVTSNQFKQASALTSLLRHLVARNYARIDLAYALQALPQMNPDLEARDRRLASQLAVIRQIKDRMDGCQLRADAAAWQHRASALALARLKAATQPAASQPTIDLPAELAELTPLLSPASSLHTLGVPEVVAGEHRPLWAELQSRKLLAQAELIPAQETLVEQEEILAKENAYFSQFKPEHSLYAATKEMHDRVVSQYDEAKCRVDVLESQIRTLTHQQLTLQATTAEERQWCAARWQEEVQKLDELAQKLTLAKLVNERQAVSFEMEKLQMFDTPENQARLDTLKDKAERIDARTIALRVQLKLPPVPTPTPAPVFRPQTRPREE